eukprot:SM000132S26864  [mRNA]  locus=s132:139237:143737:+ [translate_table: standard]
MASTAAAVAVPYLPAPELQLPGAPACAGGGRVHSSMSAGSSRAACADNPRRSTSRRAATGGSICHLSCQLESSRRGGRSSRRAVCSAVVAADRLAGQPALGAQRMAPQGLDGCRSVDGMRRKPRPEGAARRGKKMCAAGSSEPRSDRTEEASLEEGDQRPSKLTGPAGDQVEGPSQPWGNAARRKRLQEVATRVGDPFRDMITSASKRLQNYLDNHSPQTSAEESEENDGPANDWSKWQTVIAEVEERDTIVTALKFQLEDAVDKEDYQEAAKLKDVIGGIMAKDTVTEVLDALQLALAEERYADAAMYRDEAGVGLIGWWVGLAEGANDPFGRILQIYPSDGRLLGRSYTAKQLAVAGHGSAIFEIFVARDSRGRYRKQAVYLRRDSPSAAQGLVTTGTEEVVDADNQSDDVKVEEVDVEKTGSGEDEDKPKGDVKGGEEGLGGILNFLKDRMPGVKLKVFKVSAPEDVDVDLPKIVEQIMEDRTEKATGQVKADRDQSAEATQKGSGSEVSGGQKEGDGDNTASGKGEDGTADEVEEGMPVRVVLGGVLSGASNLSDDRPKLPVRVPARMDMRGRDVFLFSMEDGLAEASPPHDAKFSRQMQIATQAMSEMMPDDVAKVFWNVDVDKLSNQNAGKMNELVKGQMGEVVKAAVSQVQKRKELSPRTLFKRINVADANADSLSGLYIGAFGPYTSEVVQLQRKYGRWEGDSSADDIGAPYEYVEAVKLTGDLNVPAGQVTFRAKIGREDRLSHRGIYPEEIGVTARYKGQGRLAEPGFRNPRWIVGELVLLDGKSLAMTMKGAGSASSAELGFVYTVPEKHFLVLFNRLKLQDFVHRLGTQLS